MHEPEPLHILCDSQYAIKACTEWMPGWKRKGWRKADGKPVMNVEIIQALDAELQGRAVTFEWVKGHTNHRMNEAADVRARNAATAYQRRQPVNAGPGWPNTAPSAPRIPSPSSESTHLF